MNILDQVLGLQAADADDATDVAAADPQTRRTLKHAREQHMIGMGRYKTPSQGQLRRRAERQFRSEARKSRSKYKRNWMRNRQAIARLRGQMQVIGVIPYASADFVPTPSTVQNTVVRLEQAYGSVDAAIAHWQKIEGDRLERLARGRLEAKQAEARKPSVFGP